MMPIAALLAAASSSLSPACSQHLNGTSGTSFRGKQLGNLTFDLPPAIINVTCCSIVESYARQRSRNATAPIGFTTQVLGPSATRPGQLSVNCAAYDYGAKPIPATAPNVTSYMTGPLAPFPPPPPSCASYPSESLCPARCFWLESGQSTECTGCCDSPPIPCDDGSTSDGALCVHLVINTSQIGAATLVKTTADENTEVLVHAPKQFSMGKSAWFSFKNGVNFTSKTERFWQWSCEYTAPCVKCAKPSVYLISVGMGLTPAGWDLTPSIGGNLTAGGGWGQTPLVGTITFADKAGHGTLFGAAGDDIHIGDDMHIVRATRSVVRITKVAL